MSVNESVTKSAVWGSLGERVEDRRRIGDGESLLELASLLKTVLQIINIRLLIRCKSLMCPAAERKSM